MLLQVDDRREWACEDLRILVVEKVELIGNDDTKIFLVLEDLENLVQRSRFEDGNTPKRRS